MFSIDERAEAFKEDLLSRNIRGLALDIDETLSFTNSIYFDKLITRYGDQENLSIEETLAKYKTTHAVPYWQTDEVKQYLRELRRDHPTQFAIEPIDGAQIAIEEIARHVNIVCYITARPESIRETTLLWLKKHGFPDVPLLMRPESVDDAHIINWKGPTLEYLYPVVTGIIDDNPNFAETVSPDYKGTLFLYDTTEMPDIHVHTIVCPTWQDVVEKVKTYGTSN